MGEVIESFLLSKHQLSELKELFKWSDVTNITFNKKDNSLIVSYIGGQHDYDGIGRSKAIYPRHTNQLK